LIKWKSRTSVTLIILPVSSQSHSLADEDHSWELLILLVLVFWSNTKQFVVCSLNYSSCWSATIHRTRRIALARTGWSEK